MQPSTPEKGLRCTLFVEDGLVTFLIILVGNSGLNLETDRGWLYPHNMVSMLTISYNVLKDVDSIVLQPCVPAGKC